MPVNTPFPEPLPAVADTTMVNGRTIQSLTVVAGPTAVGKTEAPAAGGLGRTAS
jgi:hypothetical protein